MIPLGWLLGITAVVTFMPVGLLLYGHALAQILGESIGWYLLKRTAPKRAIILKKVAEEEAELAKETVSGKRAKGVDEEWERVESYTVGNAVNGDVAEKDWEGIVGFLHPFCNAGGGGERVLWAAVRATQQRWPKATCVVYTGDHDVTKEKMLERVENRFNIQLHAPTVTFLYLTTRHLVLASTWSFATLLGQSFGSLFMAYDAFSLLVPDIFVDTMGYAFALGLCKLMFPNVPTGAYVHYPTISTDMLASLDSTAPSTHGVNAGQGAGARGAAKKVYWEVFAKIYGWVGSSIDVVMTNSTWTQGHIRSLWGGFRAERGPMSDIAVVYPPVAVEELESEIEISAASEKKRSKTLLYIAQFRPEKNHTLILNSFAEFMRTKTPATKGAKLVLVGSVRDDSDSKRVYELRLLANELQIKDSVEFHLDASWPEILEWLRKASVGVNGMWNEHFGIGVVEYQAAGLVAVVHKSGGPKIDIVTEVEGKPTGFHATTATEFAEGFEEALSLKDTLDWRRRARLSSKRFTEEEFAKRFIKQMETLVVLQVNGPGPGKEIDTHFTEGFHM
ncbi:hypothetical protein V496_00305 [Pseudogymnoascus sp. VKM F-4515 (FW-2607)]|nr:hypothetical protein V496_00305 [Pseudogymnoascus sp. VKM F-4515 (FW-2607)]KFY95057.1 hypothetical protein V498_03570 [Pseudogymnoascus sp. VKM F-4517 (FW-2822)]